MLDPSFLLQKSQIPPDLMEFFEPAECGKCYVCEMVAVFREVRRVLRDDGCLWLNVGDSYAKNGVSGPQGKTGDRASCTFTASGIRKGMGDAKPKDLLGIPWLLAFALRADGWFLRSDIIWHKPNPMPESARDRPTSAHEHVFLLTKAQRYFYDAGAIAEAADYTVLPDRKPSGDYSEGSGRNDAGGHRSGGFVTGTTRNARNVWTIATQPFSSSYLDFAGADYVDDHGTPRKLSPDCPVHGLRGLLQQGTRASVSCGGPAAHPCTRTNTDGHLASEQLCADAPIDCCKEQKSSDSPLTSIPDGISASRTPDLSPDAEEGETPSNNGGTQEQPVRPTTDCDPREGSKTAIENSSQNRKTAPALGSSVHGMLFEELPSSTPRIEPRLSAMPLCERIDESKNAAGQPALHENGTAPFEPEPRTSRTRSGKSSSNNKCLCAISKGSHFATMSPDLAERCIKAGTKPGDTVLDPFGGAGTTGLVADRLNRNAVLIELNPDYRTLAADRLRHDAPLLAVVA